MNQVELPRSISDVLHSRPPYNNVWERLADKPRQALRRARKALFLPASETVRVLSDHITYLHEEVVGNHEDFSRTLGLRVDAALVSTPHLPGLYQEDILDAIEYSGSHAIAGGLALTPINGRSGYDQPRNPLAAMAGNGWGLCRNYTNVLACEAEEKSMPTKRVFTIEFTNSSLHTDLQSIKNPHLHYESYSPVTSQTTFSLSCTITENTHNKDEAEQNWQAMISFLLQLPLAAQVAGESPITHVQVLSECFVPEYWGWLLLDVFDGLEQEPDFEPAIVDPLWVAARGARELAVRWAYSHEGRDGKVVEWKQKEELDGGVDEGMDLRK